MALTLYAILTGILNVLNGLGAPVTIAQWIMNILGDKRLRDENIVVYTIDKVRLNPSIIMGVSGLPNHGFNANLYIDRKLDNNIEQSIKNNPYTIIRGRAGSGKSRAIYQYLLSNKHSFELVVVLNRKSLTCKMEELQRFLLPHIRNKVPTLIYIDDFQEIKDSNKESGWSEWESIIEDAQKYNGTLVFVSRDKEDFENEVVIDIASIERNSEEHKQCTERFHSAYFSPIIGSYIERTRVEDVVNTQSELILISSHNFITHYFHRRGRQEDYLKKVYDTVCDHLAREIGKEEVDVLKSQFSTALKALRDKGILSKENELADELFASDLADYLYNKQYSYEKLKNDVVAADAVAYKCALLTTNRSSLSYLQEKELVKLMLSIEINDIEVYVRAITRATGQNTIRIATFVRSQFNKNFIGKEDKTTMDKITQVIGIIVSRTYYGWDKMLDEYLEIYPSIKESNDIIAEVLRIATDERSSKSERQRAMDYIHSTLKISEEQLQERARKDIRIALNYERTQEQIDADRIVSVLSLLYNDLSNAIDDYNDAVNDAEKQGIEDTIHYKVRDILSWTRTIAVKVSSYEQLERLVNTLRLHSRTLKSLQKKVIASPGSEMSQFTFFSYTSLWGIAHNIHKAYPIGYDKQYQRCINLLVSLIKKENYIVDESGFSGFMLVKPHIDGKKIQKGALAELKTFKQIYDCIKQVRNLSPVEKEEVQKYIAWLYRLISVIKTTEDFELANQMLEEFLSSKTENKRSVEGKRKLYNNLLSNAPWENAKNMLDEGQFLYNEYDSYTISSLFKAAKNAFYSLSRNIYVCSLNNNKEEQIQDAIKISEILKTIYRGAQLSRSKELKWEGSSKTSLEGISKRLSQCIQQKEQESETNPKLRDFIAEHGQVAQYLIALDELKSEIQDTGVNNANSTTVGADIAEAQDWNLLSVSDMKLKLTEIRDYFFEGILNETGRTLTSDKITHLIKRVTDMVENTYKFQKFQGEFVNDTKKIKENEKWNFAGEDEREVVALLEQLVYEGKDGNPNKTLDAYIPVKLYYYAKVGVFLIDFINPDPVDRYKYVLSALRHLHECGNPISEGRGEAHNKRNEKNIFEILLSDLSFDETAVMIDAIKQVAQVDVYSNVYSAQSIVVLCNKMKKDLQCGDEDLLIQRINRVNEIISDGDQLEKTGTVLFFDADEAPKISKINSYLTKRNNDHPQEIFFKKLSKEIRINLPIASTNTEIRHAAWDMYDEQDSLYDIKRASLSLFLYREMQYICEEYSAHNNLDLFAYFSRAMDLLHDEHYIDRIDTSMSIEKIHEKVGEAYTKYQTINKAYDIKLLEAKPWIIEH